MIVIPNKSSESRWTDEQWQAIHAQGKNILVAAAAGSGKTAVLVERIIQRIADEENPTDVDRLLVVTFTKAAASEMKGRIREALEKELGKKPWSLHLRRQLMLLNRASISTLHSFCMEVVQRYAYVLDLDPSFRVADETEAKLLRQDVMDQLFEEAYSKGEEGGLFFTLVDWYTGDRSDDELQKLVERLYDFSQSHPWPEIWLEEMAGMYQVDSNCQLDDLSWCIEIKREVHMELLGLKTMVETAIQLAQEPGGPLPYLDNLEEERSLIEIALQGCHGSWEQIRDAFGQIQFGRLKGLRGDGFDEGLKEEVKEIRDQVKARVKKIQESYFRQSSAEIVADLIRMAPIMKELVELVKEFGRRFQVAKLEKGVVDFSDLEHYTLQILRHPDSDSQHLIPGDMALSYRQYFVEILVDEYQDTNMVQESILRLISRVEAESGNLFMVGDVKQSIYRFRLTEPRLFLEKYRQYRTDGVGDGLRIDLAKNFRSREEILLGTNFIFKQIMRADVAEMDYDRQAELVLGATDYPDLDESAIELHLIDRSQGGDAEPEDEEYSDPEEFGNSYDSEISGTDDIDDLENAQLEARLIGEKIKQMIKEKMPVYDRSLGRTRPITYRDIVLLLRSTSHAAPLFIEEFRLQGIPAYAEVGGGYFVATEIEVMLSLLRIIDNPYQDIPLAAVLRSPIVQLSADQLASLRVHSKEGSYYEAFLRYLGKDGLGTNIDEHKSDDCDVVKDGIQGEGESSHDSSSNAESNVWEPDEEIKERLTWFHERLEDWRTAARQGDLSSLIWRIYRETGYYDFVGGLNGGNQRQANLRVLYDRARQFEQTSLRGLFRFLRFIERMQERGEEMGTARTLGEQEDVIRLMTIHKSKGLEFPVVFIAGLGKQFNQQDLKGGFLYHKELGFGSKYVDTNLRIYYPTLPQLAIRRRLWMEMVAEEMRLLYVALTRAKEKAFLIGTIKDINKTVQKWRGALFTSDWQLPAHLLSKCTNYLDWIGYALIRHPAAQPLHQLLGLSKLEYSSIGNHPSKWKLLFTKAESLKQVKDGKRERNIAIWQAITELRPIEFGDEDTTSMMDVTCDDDIEMYKSDAHVLEQRLSWKYPYALASNYMSKQSVSEIKRRLQIFADEEEIPTRQLQITHRPRFMEEKGLTAAERGTAMHMVMQQLDLSIPPTPASVKSQVEQMIVRELLTSEQGATIDVAQVVGFFRNELGRRMLMAGRVEREVPFSYVLPAPQVYPEWQSLGYKEEEYVLIQGIIDTLFEEEDGWVLVDYKTDQTVGISNEALVERYQTQIQLYGEAITKLWKKPLKQKILYFFNGDRMIEV